MKALCVALHDVAPETWPQCAALLDLLDGLGVSPLTLLVVPDWHARGRIDADAGFVRAIEHRRARGDEIALHGYFHRDDAPPPRTPTTGKPQAIASTTIMPNVSCAPACTSASALASRRARRAASCS